MYAPWGEILNRHVDPVNGCHRRPSSADGFGVAHPRARGAVPPAVRQASSSARPTSGPVIVPSLAELRDLDELRATLEDPRGLEPRHREPGAAPATCCAQARAVSESSAPPLPAGPRLRAARQESACPPRRCPAPAGNERMTQALVEVNEKVGAVRASTSSRTERVRSTVDEHVRILELVLADRLPRPAPPPPSARRSPSSRARRPGARAHGGRGLTADDDPPSRPHLVRSSDRTAAPTDDVRLWSGPLAPTSSRAPACGAGLRCGVTDARIAASW